MSTNTEDYVIKGGTLYANKVMLHDQDLMFDAACNQLLDVSEENLVVDLTNSTYINSTYVGILAATFFQARARNKSLRLKASQAVAQVLRAAGFEEFIPIEEVVS